MSDLKGKHLVEANQILEAEKTIEKHGKFTLKQDKLLTFGGSPEIGNMWVLYMFPVLMVLIYIILSFTIDPESLGELSQGLTVFRIGMIVMLPITLVSPYAIYVIYSACKEKNIEKAVGGLKILKQFNFFNLVLMSLIALGLLGLTTYDLVTDFGVGRLIVLIMMLGYFYLTITFIIKLITFYKEIALSVQDPKSDKVPDPRNMNLFLIVTVILYAAFFLYNIFFGKFGTENIKINALGGLVETYNKTGLVNFFMNVFNISIIAYALRLIKYFEEKFM